MGHRHQRGHTPSARTARRTKLSRRIKTQQQATLPRLRSADRRSLLTGTALASTLLLSSLLAPTPAHALTNCLTGFPPPGPITLAVADDIICINVDDRFNNAGNVIDLTANGGNNYINLFNSGTLNANNAAGEAIGIFTRTNGGNGPISIENIGDIFANALTAGDDAEGIHAFTNNGNGPIGINNSADITVNAGGRATAIYAFTNNGSGPIDIVNSGDLTANAGTDAIGIAAFTNNGFGPLSLENSGDLTANAGRDATGIDAFTNNGNSPLSLENSGDLTATAVRDATGIDAFANNGNSPLSIVNSGNFTLTAGRDATGIDATANNDNSPLNIENSGDIAASAVRFAYGISATTIGADNPLSIVNSGGIAATAGSVATGIEATTVGAGNPLSIENSGDIAATATGGVGFGIRARTVADRLSIENSGDIAATALGDAFGVYAGSSGANAAIAIVNSGDITIAAGLGYSFGIFAKTYSPGSPISIINSGAIDPDIGVDATTYGAGSGIEIDNSGDVEGTYLGIATLTTGANSATHIVNSGTATSTGGPGFFLSPAPPFFIYSVAIGATTVGPGSDIIIENSGTARGLGPLGIGIGVVAGGAGSRNLITNSGSVYGGYSGIQALSYTGTKIVNSGDISAGSFFAIGVLGASAEILNAGRITGFVALTDYSDIFINQQGGVFETKLTSYFGYGNDLFRNEEGGTVLAATDPSVSEHSSFVGLERFENKGLVTMQDGAAGDSFQISNTLGATDLEFVGSGKSALAIDAFLGGPGSVSDTFIIDGNVSGKTGVDVNNLNQGPGTFNKEGIPVVYVNGPNVTGDAFFLNNPIDTGFFNYDLFFRPTGSGVFELRSFIGPGAFVLPQLITSAQDIWHSGSDTWFDRTADLRVLLNGGGAPTAYDPNAKYAEGTTATPGITPAVWVRGSGNWLDREDSESVTAYSRSYKYNLNRDLETIDFQTGIDFGKRGLLSDNDILVFGALGGFVHADLDYDALNRAFDYEGGQVGGYATYLRGGLFVDTLLNVHLLEIDTRTLGFPNSLNATTVGLRTDTGYRFGSFSGGAFLEPLATLSVNWADIDGFALGGNKVSFDDEANVRGRLGLRVGTSFPVWAGTTMEPFVIGSLWGNLTDSNEATLVSTGTTFHLEDNLDDVWGEVSVGANFFNPTASTSVFAKLDVTFGDDVEGVGGKAGMRVSW